MSHGVKQALEWVGGTFPLPSYVHDEEEPYRPIVILWLEPSTDLVVGSLLTHPRDTLASAAGSFFETTKQPLAGAPRMPARLRVASGDLAHALQGQLGDVEVVHAPTPELDRAIAGMTEHMRNASREDDDDDVTHLSSTISAELVGKFYAACAGLWKAAPWERTPSDSYIRVVCPALEIESGALCVVGQGGESFGFALFRTEADAEAYLEASEQMDRSLVPQHIMLGYSPRSEVPKSIAREVMSHGWTICDDHMYPNSTLIDADLSARPLTREELRGVTAIVIGLAMFSLEPDYEEAWEAGEGDDGVGWSSAIDVEGKIDVTLEAPLLLGGEHPEERHARHVGEVDEAAHALLDELELAIDAGESTLEYSDALLHGAAETYGRLLVDLTPEELDSFLFEVLPAEALLDPAEAPAALDALRALLEYVARRGTTSADTAKALLESIPANAEAKLTEVLADESLYTPTKRLVRMGEAAGYDMSTETGFQRFVASLKAKTQKEKAKEKAPVKAKTKAAPPATPAKKPAPKKPAPKKPAPKKPAPKKPAPKQAASKTAALKTAASKKPAPKKPAPKRAAPKKPARGAVASKTAAAKKKPARR